MATLQSTSNLKYDIRPPEIQTLLILGHVLKTRWPPSNFLNKCYICAIIYPL